MIAEGQLEQATRDRFVPTEPPGINDTDITLASERDSVPIGDEVKALLDQFVEAARRDVRRYPSTAKPLIVLASALTNAGDLTEAQASLEEALSLAPSSQMAKYALARLLFRQGNMMKARIILEELRASRPRDPEPLVGLASIAVHANDLNTAEHLCRDALSLAPRTVDGYLVMGHVLLRQQRVDRAIATYRAALRVDNRSAVAYYALGVAHAIKGNARRAEEALHAARAIAPTMGEAVRVLSRLLLNRASPDAVIELLGERIDQDPSDVEARYLIASAYLHNRSYREARRQLYRAYSVLVSSPNPDMAALSRIANNLGATYELMHDTKKAEHYYGLAIQHSPEHGPLPFQNVVRMRIAHGNLKEAWDALREAENRYPDTPRLQHLHGYLLYDEDRFDESVAYLKSAIEFPGVIEETFGLLANILSEERGDNAEAVRVLADLEERFGRTLISANQLAYTYLMAGDVAAAESVLSHKYPGEDDHVEMMATRGLYELRRGNLAAGESGYLQAAALARRQGNQRLEQIAMQKMHLEFARTLAHLGNLKAANEHVRKGIQGKPSHGGYTRALHALNTQLREGSRYPVEVPRSHRVNDLRSLAYHRLVAERLEHDPQLLVRAQERVDGWLSGQTAFGGSREYALAWKALLSRPLEEIQRLIVEDTGEMRDLRQSTPFGGLLEPSAWESIVRQIGVGSSDIGGDPG